VNTGNALLGAQRYPEAEAAFRKGVVADPDDTKALQGLVTALDKQGKYTEEATVAEHMANVFMKQANQAAPAPAAAAPTQAPANGDNAAQIAELKRELAALQGATGAANVAHDAAPVHVVAAAMPANPVAIVPLDQSAIVTKVADGELGVSQKDGTPVEGFKLSQHDMLIASPSIAVAPDGTIHVAFLEEHNTTYVNAIYHRSSSDGGKTWTDAKNLTEDMPEMKVGRCQVLADAGNRVYVIWRAAIPASFDVSPDLGGSPCCLWFRELEGGKWSRAKSISETGGGDPQYSDAAYSFFAVVDAAGHAQVVWNAMPDHWHPELVTRYGHSNGVGPGLVLQSTLDGANASIPREVFLPVVTPGTVQTPPSCDGLDTLTGYVDSASSAHFISLATMPMYGLPQHKAHYELIEDGKAGASIVLPPLSFHATKDIPTLLVDATGKRHMIAMFLAGEHPNFRDYLIGSDEDPTVILAAKGLNGIVEGFQAYQGPGGHMVVIMQTKTGDISDLGDTWVSMSDGTGWSKPICVTNNAARRLWATTNTGQIGSVSHGTAYHPGVGAAAFDREGHLILALVNGEVGSFGSAIGGALIASGGTEKPMLFFYRL
jgi:hypothetical protein